MSPCTGCKHAGIKLLGCRIWQVLLGADVLRTRDEG